MDAVECLERIDKIVAEARRRGEGKRIEFIEIGSALYEDLPGDWIECGGGEDPYVNCPPKDMYGIRFRVVEGDAEPKVICRSERGDNPAA